MCALEQQSGCRFFASVNRVVLFVGRSCLLFHNVKNASLEHSKEAGLNIIIATSIVECFARCTHQARLFSFIHINGCRKSLNTLNDRPFHVLSKQSANNSSNCRTFSFQEQRSWLFGFEATIGKLFLENGFNEFEGMFCWRYAILITDANYDGWFQNITAIHLLQMIITSCEFHWFQSIIILILQIRPFAISNRCSFFHFQSEVLLTFLSRIGIWTDWLVGTFHVLSCFQKSTSTKQTCSPVCQT